MGRGRTQLVDEALAAELIARAQAEGVQLLGEGGLLQHPNKVVLEMAAATAAAARRAGGS